MLTKNIWSSAILLAAISAGFACRPTDSTSRPADVTTGASILVSNHEDERDCRAAISQSLCKDQDWEAEEEKQLGMCQTYCGDGYDAKATIVPGSKKMAECEPGNEGWDLVCKFKVTCSCG